MKKKFTFGMLILLGVVATAVLTPRFYKDVKKKRGFENTYAIQNLATENLRIHNASNANGTGVILYSHHEWECMTWRLIQMEENMFLLQNLYTQKSIQLSSTLKDGVGLWQQPLGGREIQSWEFLKQSDESFRIRLKGTELYLTAPSADNNSAIILTRESDSDSQVWRLIRQNPLI